MIDANLAALRDALQRRVDVVADRELYARDPAEHLAELKLASEKVDDLAGAVVAGGGAAPMLAHFLERQSYSKALDFLRGLPQPLR